VCRCAGKGDDTTLRTQLSSGATAKLDTLYRLPGTSGGLAQRFEARIAGGERAFIATPPAFNDGKMESGTAKRWNEKGYGFIQPDDGGEDVFCHFSGISDGRMLIEGTKVEFIRTYDDRKGKYRAESVTGGAPEENRGQSPAIRYTPS